jgi:hypothetical protein
MPAHYVWTPGGFLFVPGYWDLPVASRGLLFAPVYYPQPVYAQAGFVFSPSISIVGSAVTANLFVQASTNQYLFGDFYAQSFVSVGIVPWFSFTFVTGRPAFYDPLFSYYAVVNVRENPRWIAQVRESYTLRRENIALRPPRTYIEQTRFIDRNVTITRDINVVDHRTVAMPLHQLAADPVAGRNMRLVRVNEAERQQIRQQAAQLHEFREQRLQQERAAARGGTAARPRTMSLPHSPIAAHHPAAEHAGATGAHASGAAHRAEPSLRAPGSREAVAHRPEATREPYRGANPQGSRAGFGEPAARGASQPRPAPGGGSGSRGPYPGSQPYRPTERPGMPRTGAREPQRSAGSQRGVRGPTAEERERRP